MLSIIIPVYNTEKTLERCLESIIKAKINNTEIIIINDGSTDNSINIIKKYCKKYKYITYIEKNNEGLSETKNKGIKQAKGNYISFVDSDDTVNENFYKAALEYMNKDYDMIIYDFNNINIDNNFPTEAENEQFKSFGEPEALLYTSIMPSSCNKIVKTNLFKNNNISFPKGLLYEDLATTPLLFAHAKKIKYISKSYYNYYINNSSIMRNDENEKHMQNMLESIKILYKKSKKYFNDDFYIFNCMWRIEDYIIFYLCNEEDKKKKLKNTLLLNKIYKVIKRIYNDKRVIKSFQEIEDYDVKNYYLKRNEFLKKRYHLKLYLFLNKININNKEKIDFCYYFNQKIINMQNN